MCLVTLKAVPHHITSLSSALSHPTHNSFYYNYLFAPLPPRVPMPFTPDNDLEFLFPEELVPQHIKDELPPELHVRQTSRHPLPRLFHFLIIHHSLSDSLMRPPARSHRRFAHWLRQTTRAGTSPCSACSRKLLMWVQRRGQLSSKRCAASPRRTTSSSSSRARPIRS